MARKRQGVVNLTLRLDSETHAFFTASAKASGRSLNAEINRALATFMVEDRLLMQFMKAGLAQRNYGVDKSGEGYLMQPPHYGQTTYYGQPMFGYGYAPITKGGE